SCARSENACEGEALCSFKARSKRADGSERTARRARTGRPKSSCRAGAAASPSWTSRASLLGPRPPPKPTSAQRRCRSDGRRQNTATASTTRPTRSPARLIRIFRFSHNPEGTSKMKYVFANAEHTLVRCVDDGSTFELPRHTNPANIHGFAAERWRAEGCPQPAPFEAPEPAKTPDDFARRARRTASDDRRRV